MKVVLPERKKMRSKQLIIYIIIMCTCFTCICVAFYVQFFARINIARLIGIQTETEFGKKTEEETDLLKAEFEQLFENRINYEGDKSDKKKEKDKEIVYTEYKKKESKLNSYDIEVHIPKINIDNKIIDEYNKEIDSIFTSKTEEILKSQNKNIIYSVEYQANIQEDILSIIIKSNLKEGANAQKVMIKTYNYDLRNNKEISLQEVIDIEQINKNNVQDKIKKEIETEQKKVEDLKRLGYNIYSRNTNDDMYKLENTEEFYLANNTLYIIYAYGNKTLTSEVDLIII